MRCTRASTASALSSNPTNAVPWASLVRHIVQIGRSSELCGEARPCTYVSRSPEYTSLPDAQLRWAINPSNAIVQPNTKVNYRN
eukprot:m.196709 g.196709  ORF g.196709 m.196709 type:complete len:84 (-) comp25067_c0_seq1:5-256(-)